MVEALKKFWKKAIVLSVIGIAFVLLLNGRVGGQNGALLTDIFFSMAMAFFIYGMIHQIGNMGMFASMVYGWKCIKQLFRGDHIPGGSLKEGYLEYLKSRPKHTDVGASLLIAVCCLALSIITYFLFFR